MHCGEMKQPPPTVTNCDTQCHVCDGTHSKTFLPVIFSSSFVFLKSARFGAVLGVEIDVENGAAFAASLASNGDECKRVFSLKNQTLTMSLRSSFN